MKTSLHIKKIVTLKLVFLVCLAVLTGVSVSAYNRTGLPGIQKQGTENAERFYMHHINQAQIIADTNAPVVYPVIYTNLLSANNNGFSLMDGIAAAFDNRFSAAVDVNDAMKLWNFGENIALIRHDTALAIEFRPVPSAKDTLFYRLYLRQQPYTLKIFTQNCMGIMPIQAWLVDKYLHTQTEVNLHDTTLYNFTTYTDSNNQPDTNSYRNRFMLVLNKEFSATPVQVTKIIDENDPGITGIANSFAKREGSVVLYPNPLTSGNAMLNFTNMSKGSYEILIYTAKGQKLQDYAIQHFGGNKVYTLPVSTWSAGVYRILVTNKDLKKPVSLQLLVTK